jgi:hypothetical protein
LAPVLVGLDAKPDVFKTQGFPDNICCGSRNGRVHECAMARLSRMRWITRRSTSGCLLRVAA